MAGNVVTHKGAENLYAEGVDLIRVGIGSGMQCRTREQTGVGYPQLSAIDDCSKIHRREKGYLIYKENIPIMDKAPWITISDGGIINSGNAVKSLATGADACMLGTILGTTFESDHNGIIRGMASREHQLEVYGKVKSVEGTETSILKARSLEELITEWSYNIKSACTYMDAKNLTELKTNVNWTWTGSGTLKWNN
jgi:hypothetical protein